MLFRSGFLTGEYFKVVHSLNEIQNIINEIDAKRNTLDYLIDGLVIKINNENVRSELGFTEKTPRWAIAYKFEAEETSTILKDITWQVGRTGKITPVAELEDTELCGVTIKRATLNNYNDIQRKKLKLGDRVFIRRSNDVIPEVMSVAETYKTSKVIQKPTLCPCCGSVLEDTNTELYCKNHFGCRTQIVLKLVQFASRNAMNIDGLSVKTLERLYDTYNVKSFSDIYKISAKELAELEGFKDKKISNILNSIQKSRHAKLSNFIFALGIDGIGVKMAKQLAKIYKDINVLMTATREELIALDDIAEITANGIIHYFNETETKSEIEELLNNFVEIEKENKVINLNGFFAGKKVVLTGTLSEFSRPEATKLIEELGGEVSTSVSPKTNIVLVGENAGNKLAKAQKIGRAHV